MMSRLIIAVVIISFNILPCWALDSTSIHSDDKLLEYRIKTAFLYNFAKFIDWPPDPFRIASNEFIIGMIAPPELISTAKMLRSKTVRGAQVKVIFFKSSTEIVPCHMLFIAIDDEKLLKSVIERFKYIPVLTVADTAGFASQGGVINFIRVNNTIRFEINPEVAEEKNLRISSKLLNLAKIVRSPEFKEAEK